MEHSNNIKSSNIDGGKTSYNGIALISITVHYACKAHCECELLAMEINRMKIFAYKTFDSDASILLFDKDLHVRSNLVLSKCVISAQGISH